MVIEFKDLKAAPTEATLPLVDEHNVISTTQRFVGFVQAAADLPDDQRAARLALFSQDVLPAAVTAVVANLEGESPQKVFQAAQWLVSLGQVNQLIAGLESPSDVVRGSILSALAASNFGTPEVVAAIRRVADNGFETSNNKVLAGLALQRLVRATAA